MATPKNTTKKFGLTFGGALLVLGLIAFWRGHATAPYLVSLGGIFLVLALAVPKALRPVEKLWLKFGEILGYVMTRVLLFIIFFFVLTPLSLVARVFGKSFLDLSWHKPAKTYWHEREKKPADPKIYEKQF